MTDRRPCSDLTQKIAGMSVSGEMLNLVNVISDMIDQFAIFAKLRRSLERWGRRTSSAFRRRWGTCRVSGKRSRMSFTFPPSHTIQSFDLQTLSECYGRKFDD